LKGKRLDFALLRSSGDEQTMLPLLLLVATHLSVPNVSDLPANEVDIRAQVIQVQEFDYHGELLTNILYIDGTKQAGLHSPESVTLCGGQADKILAPESRDLVFHVSRVKHRSNCNELVSVE
jgi:hypothetical protein